MPRETEEQKAAKAKAKAAAAAAAAEKAKQGKTTVTVRALTLHHEDGAHRHAGDVYEVTAERADALGELVEVVPQPA